MYVECPFGGDYLQDYDVVSTLENQVFLANQAEGGKALPYNSAINCNGVGICDGIRLGTEVEGFKTTPTFPAINHIQARHMSVYPEFGHDLKLVVMYDSNFLNGLHGGDKKLAENTIGISRFFSRKFQIKFYLKIDLPL